MRILIVGAGATGGYLGARLAEIDRDVTFLVRPGRADRLRQDGLQILSPRGNVALSPRLHTAETLRETFDVVLLTVKSHQLAGAMDDIAPAIGRDTMILPVLNGMAHLERLKTRFGARNLVGCALKLATVLDPQGRILQVGPVEEIAYGELDGGQSTRLLALHECFQGTGMAAHLSPAILREMWQKWALLATLGAVTCLLGGPVGEIIACPGGALHILRQIEEVVAVVRIVGLPPAEDFLGAMVAQLTAEGSPLTSSMYRDMRQGRPVEIEAILGDMMPLAT